MLAPEEQPEFQWHVKSGKARNRIQCDGGQIVDSESALLNDSFDFGEPKLPRIVFFKGGASDETKIINAEDNCVEYWPVAGIKRTIDEDVAIS